MAIFVQGFLAKIIIDGQDQTPITVDYTLTQSTTPLDKSVMDSSGVSRTLPGMTSGNLVFNGHISTAELNALQVSKDKAVPITFALTITQGLGTDSEYTGSFVFSEFTVGTAVEDNWAFTASGPTDGAITYVPAVV